MKDGCMVWIRDGLYCLMWVNLAEAEVPVSWHGLNWDKGLAWKDVWFGYKMVFLFYCEST